METGSPWALSSTTHLRDLQPPQLGPLTAARVQHGPLLTPRKIIKTYDADEWELFIEEWATSLQPKFVAVSRYGGSGDMGVDVAGFHTDRGFEGPWQCFQGKFYNKSLTPGTAWPEILKIFLLHINNPTYTLPVRYLFLAPNGMATGLAHLLSSPLKLRDGFLEQLAGSRAQPFSLLEQGQRRKVKALASETDFSRFGSVEVRDLIEEHKTTPFFAARFGGGLPSRPIATPVPDQLDEAESIYIQKLIDAYIDKYRMGVNTLVPRV